MPISGLWLRMGAGEFDGDEIFDRPDIPGGSDCDAVVTDLIWGQGSPAPATDIPYSWINGLSFRSDQLRNVATISTTQTSNAAQKSDSASVTEFGEVEYSATLDTAIDVDPANLADWVLAYLATQPGAVPRMRIPTVVFSLLPRTDVERWTLLGRRIGDRVHFTGTPAGWPEGTTTGVIEGIGRSISLGTTAAPVVAWNLAAVVGSTAGSPGPWFRTDISLLDGADKVPF